MAHKMSETKIGEWEKRPLGKPSGFLRWKCGVLQQLWTYEWAMWDGTRWQHKETDEWENIPTEP